jgi:hypothetical protein
MRNLESRESLLQSPIPRQQMIIPAHGHSDKRPTPNRAGILLQQLNARCAAP